MKQTISACIIAKNEEAMLPRCLESIKWVDEIIFVDTGSTDRTMEIARSYGAKVYEHPWQKDFSLHRNQAIGYATGDWVLIIDCDEEITSDMSCFKTRLSWLPDDVSGLIVRVHENDVSWLGTRFFRRSSGVQYYNAVHNKAKYNGKSAGIDVNFKHYGYSLSPDKMHLKRERTRELLLNRLEENEKDFDALYYMCQMCIGEKRYNMAIEYGMKFFNCVPVHPDKFQFYSVMYFYMAWAWLRIGDGGKSSAWALKGLEFYPDDIDLHFVMAEIGYRAGKNEWLRQHGDKYRSLCDDLYKASSVSASEFENKIMPIGWQNRTIYSANYYATEQIRKFMEETLD